MFTLLLTLLLIICGLLIFGLFILLLVQIVELRCARKNSAESVDVYPPVVLPSPTEDVNNDKMIQEIKQYHFEQRPIFSKAERTFFLCLTKHVIPEGFSLFPKIHLWGLVKNLEKSGWCRINQKHLDYVVFYGEYYKPVVVIELDDSTHSSASAVKRDTAKDCILQSAGIPILRIQQQDYYNIKHLRALLMPYLEKFQKKP